MPVLIDYAVVTYPRVAAVQAHMPLWYARVKDGKPRMMYGYRGRGVEGLFVGESEHADRVMISTSGAMAHFYRTLLYRELDVYISVARIDLQATIETLDADADIHNIQWRGGYKVTKYASMNERGATLYIGSPKSRMRMRIYNKSAEAGIQAPSGYDYIRYELQLRDKYADAAFAAYRNGTLEQYYLSQVMKMLEQVHYKTISEAINATLDSSMVHLLSSNHEDWADRRMRWIEAAVVPAIIRLCVASPRHAEAIKRTLTMILGEIDARDSKNGNGDND